jgi:hypothetical protein
MPASGARKQRRATLLLGQDLPVKAPPPAEKVPPTVPPNTGTPNLGQSLQSFPAAPPPVPPMRLTDLRAPGPGPIRVDDWLRLSQKWCVNRKLIIHSDSAKAYDRKVRGCLHDAVVHKKRRVFINGRWQWLKPVYTKIVKHVLPDTRRTIRVQAGTQYIDGFWRILRATVRPWRMSDAAGLRRLTRVAQLRYWSRGKDFYIEAAKALKWRLDQTD